MPEEWPPMFTKPAGVFPQLLGAVAIVGGVFLLAATVVGSGLVAALIGVGLLWLGRLTHPRKA